METDVLNGLLQLVGVLLQAVQGNLVDLHIEEPGWDVLSKHILNLNTELGKVGITSADSLMGVGKALGAIFALIVAAGRAYKMMTLDGKFDILEISRPLLLAFAIANTGAIVRTVTYPGELLEQHFRAEYNRRCGEISDLRKKRFDQATDLKNFMGKKLTASEEAKNAVSEDPDWWDGITEAIGDLWEGVVNIRNSWLVMIWTMIFNGLENVFIFIGEMAFQVAVYLIFLIKAIMLAVLTLFGPVQLACSILPVWKDAWASWIGRLVSVSMYGAMAYLVMSFTLVLLKFSYDADIIKLTTVLTTTDGLMAYIGSMLGTCATVIVTYFCGALAMSAVPEMASWCIPGGSASMGASHFIGGMQGKANQAVNKATGGVVRF